MSKQKKRPEEFFYELSFWLTARLTDEELKKDFQKIKTLIEDFKGKIISENFPQLRALAYPIKKETSGYFGFLQFELAPEKIEELVKKIKELPNILRHLIVKKMKISSHLPSTTQKKIVTPKKRKSMPEKIEAVNLQELDKKLNEILKE